jgi:dTDP-4-amino-4,6-dideoxygalactose transaminase
MTLHIEKMTVSPAIILSIFTDNADMNPILEIAKANRLFVIEDAAQAWELTIKCPRAWSAAELTEGDLACFSFFPTKNLRSGMLESHDRRPHPGGKVAS